MGSLKRVCVVGLCGCISALNALPQTHEKFLLIDGTVMKLRLNRTLSSADARVDDRVDFAIVEDVKVDDVVVIAQGAPAWATVTRAKKKRRMGRGGKLDMNIDDVLLVSGEKAVLRAVKETSGGGNTGKMTGAMVATGILFFPAAPLFLLWKGKDITIPKGTEITAYIHGDVELDRRKFASEPSSSLDAQLAVSGTPMTNEDVLALIEAGLSESLILATIKASPGNYRLATADIIAMTKRNVSDVVIQAMIEAPTAK